MTGKYANNFICKGTVFETSRPPLSVIKLAANRGPQIVPVHPSLARLC